MANDSNASVSFGPQILGSHQRIQQYRLDTIQLIAIQSL